MNTETEYVTAPFVQECLYDGRKFLRRIDGDTAPGRLLEATPAVLRGLEAFAPVRSYAEAREQLRDLADDDVHAAFEALLRCNMVLEARSLVLRPPSLEIEVTNRCNARCVMCPREALRSLGDMPPDVFAALVGFVSTVPTSGAIVQGIGEPTLHRGLDYMIRELRGALGPSRPLVVVTNGFTMTPDRLLSLREAGVDHVQWSFHSLRPALYDRIMGVPRFARAYENFVACAAADPGALSINVVVMDDNAAEVDDLRAWVRALGLSERAVRPIPCFSRAGTVNLDRIVSGSARPRDGRCLYVKKSLFVAWNGDLLPCSNDISGVAVYGNIGGSGAREIARKWRDDVLAPTPAFEMCSKCDHFLRDTYETKWFDLIAGDRVAAAG